MEFRLKSDGNFNSFRCNLMEISFLQMYYPIFCVSVCLCLSAFFGSVRTDEVRPSIIEFPSDCAIGALYTPKVFCVFCLSLSVNFFGPYGRTKPLLTFQIVPSVTFNYPKVSVFLFVCCVCLSFFFWFHVRTDEVSIDKFPSDCAIGHV
jgi:hypothetical protein